MLIFINFLLFVYFLTPNVLTDNMGETRAIYMSVYVPFSQYVHNFFLIAWFYLKIVKYYREIISLQVIYSHLISGLYIPK